MSVSRSRWISSGPVYHLVRPWTRKHSSRSVRFMLWTKPLVWGEPKGVPGAHFRAGMLRGAPPVVWTS
jgi:hypothetical protein